MEKRIIIIGAGPTGLGAAYRLKELGYRNWRIYERNNYVGGLAASFQDSRGFTWDIGGHVLFSHYPRFSQIFEKLLKGQYLSHERRAFVRIFNRWVPYPFQNNIRHLPQKYLLECLVGLIEVQRNNRPCRNFKEWILNTFGAGVAKYFMLPHNFKVWAHPLEVMDKAWIGERVSVVDVSRILENIILKRDDTSWGPNRKFKFPLRGGTQDIFKRMVPLVGDYLWLECELVKIDTKKKELKFKDGLTDKFDYLINTTPLDKFVESIYPKRKALCQKARQLRHNGVYVVGIGLKGKAPEDKCWVYSPEQNTPFFRATYFSNYSPCNVPLDRPHWSLMCEVAYSGHKPQVKNKVIAQTLRGLENCSMINGRQRNNIISTFLFDAEFAYPVPTLGRDRVLKYLQEFLEKNSIFSRGRFGAWKYEVGNMDHCLMQGIEAVERILLRKKETVWKI